MEIDKIRKRTNEILERVVYRLDKIDIETLDERYILLYAKTLLQIREDCRNEGLYNKGWGGYSYSCGCSTQLCDEDNEDNKT